jgi:hypothetical protein
MGGRPVVLTLVTTEMPMVTSGGDCQLGCQALSANSIGQKVNI